MQFCDLLNMGKQINIEGDTDGNRSLKAGEINEKLWVEYSSKTDII